MEKGYWDRNTIKGKTSQHTREINKKSFYRKKKKEKKIRKSTITVLQTSKLAPRDGKTCDSPFNCHKAKSNTFCILPQFSPWGYPQWQA